MLYSALLAALPLVAATPLVKRAPLITRDVDAIEGKYIVMLKTGGASINSAVSSIVADADAVYANLGGFAATLSDDEVEKLRSNPDVDYIQQDAKANIYATQENAPWGLARLSSTTTGSTTYKYADAGTGEGVCAYVIDTGVDTAHADFGGRATYVSNFVNDITGDDHGHGTHCAGTVGGTKYGVAKKTSIFSIKVFDSAGNGSDSLMISGMDAVLDDAPKRDCPKGVVVNMSFGGTKSTAVNDAAKALVDAGYFAVAAAGNGDWLHRPQDAGNYSPSSEASICTVGATQDNDVVASFSNYGSVVDIHAPGVNVLSDAPNNRTAIMSGTSQATPHVVGLGAYFLSLGQPAKGLCEYLQSIASEGIITSLTNGTQNLLAQNGQACKSSKARRADIRND